MNYYFSYLLFKVGSKINLCYLDLPSLNKVILYDCKNN